MDVFTGQMTSAVHEVLNKNNICVVNVPANMTHFYQPLDVTVNGYAKRFLKNKFNNWYANQISKQLDVGIRLDEIVIKLQLSLLKPLHAAWIVDFYNEMTSVKGKEISLHSIFFLQLNRENLFSRKMTKAAIRES